MHVNVNIYIFLLGWNTIVNLKLLYDVTDYLIMPNNETDEKKPMLLHDRLLALD